jgi:hypothetical protein
MTYEARIQSKFKLPRLNKPSLFSRGLFYICENLIAPLRGLFCRIAGYFVEGRSTRLFEALKVWSDFEPYFVEELTKRRS